MAGRPTDSPGQPGWTVVRSLKRLLKNAGPGSVISVAGQHLNVYLLACEMMAALRRDLLEKSTLGARKFDKLEAMLGVPANANSNQRFLTQESAREAGFEVLGLPERAFRRSGGIRPSATLASARKLA